MANDKTTILKSIRIRYTLIPVITFILAILICIRVFDIQVNQREELISIDSVQKTKVIDPNRGNILDRNGKILASSVSEYDIYFDPRIDYFQRNPEVLSLYKDSIINGLTKIFASDTNYSYRYFSERINNAIKESKMKKINKRPIDHRKLLAVKGLPLFRNGAYKGGLTIEEENNRVYPYGRMTKRTIGYLRKGEVHGLTGLEKAYDTYLYGTKDVDANIDGCDIVTTLDADVQTITHEELTKRLKNIDAEWGCAVVMDVQTGEILAMSNLSHNKDTTDKEFYENMNFAVSQRCDPGSTIKLPSLMIALEDGYVQLSDTIDTGDGQTTYVNGQLTVTDWNHAKQGGFKKITVKEVFAQSSNVGVTKIIDKYYVKTGKEWDYIERLKSMNLGMQSGIDLIGEPKPRVKDPSCTEGAEKWNPRGISLLQMSYGYEIELTPLQILTFYNGVANDGKIMRPHLMKEIRQGKKVEQRFKPQVLQSSICKKETLEKAKKMMEAVLEIGTARKFSSNYYKIAGKTGSAMTFEKGKYNRKKWRGSFCGYFPADKPKYSCIVVIQGKEDGDYSAVGVFKNIADRIYFLDDDLRNQRTSDTASIVADLPYSNGYGHDFSSLFSQLTIQSKPIAVPWIQSKMKSNVATYASMEMKNGIVPNFEKMGLRDALFIADSLHIPVTYSGKGRVSRQSIKPGTPYNPGDIIILSLN
ncbi:MAG: transpeptidase family protein [Bacteroidales bacterium]|nr:transpeptidase family protein [Bacteroidales bacterium]